MHASAAMIVFLFSPKMPLWPKALKNAGYSTCLIGKWGLGEPGTTGIPNRKGFDEFFGYLNQKHAHNYFLSISGTMKKWWSYRATWEWAGKSTPTTCLPIKPSSTSGSRIRTPSFLNWHIPSPMPTTSVDPLRGTGWKSRIWVSSKKRLAGT
ncbi:sulfatase-like hydrolase/transferase [bacterium]|nr:sulfatase-like hydrolase/transferase [bacterium]